VILDAVLFWTFVGAEGLVLAQIPVRFLDGARLRQWRPAAWPIRQAATMVFVIDIVLRCGGVCCIKRWQVILAGRLRSAPRPAHRGPR
jgi:hypothetical protein